MALAKRLPGDDKPPPPPQKVITVNLNLNDVKKEAVEEKPAPPPIRRAAAPVEPIEEPSGNGRLWFLGILLLVILSGVGLVFLARDKEDDEKERVTSRRTRRARNQV